MGETKSGKSGAITRPRESRSGMASTPRSYATPSMYTQDLFAITVLLSFRSLLLFDLSQRFLELQLHTLRQKLHSLHLALECQLCLLALSLKRHFNHHALLFKLSFALSFLQFKHRLLLLELHFLLTSLRIKLRFLLLRLCIHLGFDKRRIGWRWLRRLRLHERIQLLIKHALDFLGFLESSNAPLQHTYYHGLSLRHCLHNGERLLHEARDRIEKLCTVRLLGLVVDL